MCRLRCAHAASTARGRASCLHARLMARFTGLSLPTGRTWRPGAILPTQAIVSKRLALHSQEHPRAYSALTGNGVTAIRPSATAFAGTASHWARRAPQARPREAFGGVCMLCTVGCGGQSDRDKFACNRSLSTRRCAKFADLTWMPCASIGWQAQAYCITDHGAACIHKLQSIAAASNAKVPAKRVFSNTDGPVSEAHRGRFPLLTQDPARIAACRVTYADSSWGLACLERPPLLPIRDIWSRSRLTAWPPFRPASRASSLVNSCALPLACAALPPLLANKRRFSGSNAAKPRRLRVAFCPSSTVPPLDASMTTSLGIGGAATIVPTLKPTHFGVATTNAGKNGCARCAKVAHPLFTRPDPKGIALPRTRRSAPLRAG